MQLRRLATVAVVAAGVAYGAISMRGSIIAKPPGIRIVSWNLRNFPTAANDAYDPPHDVQRVRRELAALRPDIVVLQEVRDPGALAQVLPEGFSSVVSLQTGVRPQHLAIAWHNTVVHPIAPQIEHDALTMGGRVRPALSQRFAAGAHTFAILTVHLKARPSGAVIRTTQWDRLGDVAMDLQRGDPNLVVLGDFNVTGGTPHRDADVERIQLERRLGQAELRSVEVGGCTAYWQGVRHDAWYEPSRLDLAFVAGFADMEPVAVVGTHCRLHACAAFPSTDARPVLTLSAISDHCPLIIDLPVQNAVSRDP